MSDGEPDERVGTKDAEAHGWSEGQRPVVGLLHGLDRVVVHAMDAWLALSSPAGVLRVLLIRAGILGCLFGPAVLVAGRGLQVSAGPVLRGLRLPRLVLFTASTSGSSVAVVHGFTACACEPSLASLREARSPASTRGDPSEAIIFDDFAL